MKIIPLTQQALQAYGESLALDGLTVVRGMSNEVSIADKSRQVTISNPSLVCECRTARHNQDIKGNWLCSAAVILRLNAPDTTEEVLKTWSASMSSAFERDDLASAINSAFSASLSPDATGYTVVGRELLDAGYRLNGKVWEIFLTMEIHCCQANIT